MKKKEKESISVNVCLLFMYVLCTVQQLFFARCVKISIYRMQTGKRVRMCVINRFEHEICLKWKQSEMHLIDWPR